VRPKTTEKPDRTTGPVGARHVVPVHRNIGTDGKFPYVFPRCEANAKYQKASRLSPGSTRHLPTPRVLVFLPSCSLGGLVNEPVRASLVGMVSVRRRSCICSQTVLCSCLERFASRSKRTEKPTGVRPRLGCICRGGYPGPHRFGSVHKMDLGKLTRLTADVGVEVLDAMRRSWLPHPFAILFLACLRQAGKR
jgi:hypothetical protein